MISPFVRRRRLAMELNRLRQGKGLTTGRLAQDIGVPRQRISRLQNAHVAPDLDDLRRILARLDVAEPEWTTLMTVGRQAQERGWWEKWADEMGPRQALTANLEAGAATIREYQLTLVPGLLQTPAYTDSRATIDHPTRGAQFDRIRSLEAREIRQEMMTRPDGPRYEVIIDELAVRRPAVDPQTMAGQLDYLAGVGHSREHLTIRVLPLDARITCHAVPSSAFSVYTYSDPADPVVITVDTATADLVLAYQPEVDYYLELYHHLRGACLSPADSLSLLGRVAEELHSEKGS